jgi:MYXO-CTERM domain-containing protein
MFAHQRVVAGRLAVAFTAVFAAGCVILALTTATDAAWPAAAMGLVLLAGALAIWRRAETSRTALLARRDRLEQELGRTAQ